MNISNDATQAATEQRNSTLRSCALKWSSQDGNLRVFLARFSSSCWTVCEESDIVERRRDIHTGGAKESMGNSRFKFHYRRFRGSTDQHAR